MKPTAFNGIKIERLKMTTATAIKRRCADIYISYDHIAHIERFHKTELEGLGICALDYVKMITSKFNQIREGSGTSILLVVFNEDIHHTAAIDINYSVKKGIWEVKTAQPRSTRDVTRRKLLW